jgi:DnaK suppressor protein
MLTTQQLAEFHTKLLAEQQKLQQETVQAQQSSATVALDQQSVGRLSRMDAMQAQAMAQELARRRARQLVEIAAALKRLETGDYGYCQACDEVIGAARLGINPACRYCLNCADNC